MTAKQVFVREATGLVREFSWFDAFAIGWNSTIIFSLFLVQPAVGLFPGTNPLLALLILFPIAMFYSINYGWLAMMMPRSGGDYIFNTRIVHPAIGFLGSWLFIIASAIFGMGVILTLLVTWTLPWLLSSLGLSALASTVTQPNWVFGLGMIIIVVFGLLNIFPRKFLSRFFQATIGASIVGGALILAIILSNIGRFPQAFEASTGVKYESILPLAIKNGFNPGTNLPATILTVGWMGITVLAGVGIFVAGEVKDVKKSMLWATVWANVIVMVVYIGFMAVTYVATGYTWYNALSWLYVNTNAYPAGMMTPQINNIALMIANMPALNILIAITMFCSLLTIPPANYILASRYTFAWAFDRLLPARYADVSERFHQPLIPTIVSGVLFTCGLALSVWGGGFLSSWVSGSWIFIIWGSIGAVAGIIAPYKAKRFFEAAPSIVRARVGPVPLLTISGIIFLAFNLVIAAVAALYPSVNPLSAAQAWFIVGSAILGLAFFYAVKYYRLKKDGLDIGLIYKEIPPE